LPDFTIGKKHAAVGDAPALRLGCSHVRLLSFCARGELAARGSKLCAGEHEREPVDVFPITKWTNSALGEECERRERTIPRHPEKYPWLTRLLARRPFKVGRVQLRQTIRY
jgi:hypothetical protein